MEDLAFRKYLAAVKTAGTRISLRDFVFVESASVCWEVEHARGGRKKRVEGSTPLAMIATSVPRITAQVRTGGLAGEGDAGHGLNPVGLLISVDYGRFGVKWNLTKYTGNARG